MVLYDGRLSGCQGLELRGSALASTLHFFFFTHVDMIGSRRPDPTSTFRLGQVEEVTLGRTCSAGFGQTSETLLENPLHNTRRIALFFASPSFDPPSLTYLF